MRNYRYDPTDEVGDDEVIAAIKSVPRHFIDLVITPGDVKLVTGTIQHGLKAIPAGNTPGQAFYAAGGLAQLADAALTSVEAAAGGIILNTGADGQPVSWAPNGALVNMGATLAIGEIYVVSGAAAGGIAPYADLTSTQFVTVLGIAETNANLRVNIWATGIAKG